MTFGQWLRYKRKSAKTVVSMDSMGDAIGVSYQTISNWETDKHPPAKEHWPRIAENYRVTVEQIVARLHEDVTADTEETPETGNAGHGREIGKTTEGASMADVDSLWGALYRLKEQLETRLDEIESELDDMRGDTERNPTKRRKTS